MKARAMTLIALLTLSAAGVAGAARKPKWVDGKDPRYPDASHLLGVGIGTDLDAARSAARAEISKVFQARVRQNLTDVQTESFATKGRRRGPAAGTQQTEMRTDVATDMVLEGTEIADTWFDKKSGKNYALAVLDKKKARQSLSAQITEKEETIHTRVNQAKDAASPLEAAKHLSRALAEARARDQLAARRRVVDPSPVPDLPDGRSTAQLDKLLNDALAKIAFVIDAQPADAPRLRQAVAEQVTALGFKIADRAEAGPAVRVVCSLAVEPFDRGHPTWKFFQWRGTYELTDPDGKTVASGTPWGTDGHLVESTARAKTLEEGQTRLAEEIQKAVSTYIFGE